MVQTMKAMVFKKFGPPDVLRYEEIPMPSAGRNQVVIQVKAVSVNRVLDVSVRAGTATRHCENLNLPHVPGVDPSGVVVETGDGVTKLQVGDHVSVTMMMPNGKLFGIACQGANSEFAAVPMECCIKIPKEVPMADATVIARHGPVAHNLLFNMGRLQAGQWVLILGASGNLGSIGIQLAKAAGAHVIGAASSAAKAEVGKRLGADYSVDYSNSNLAEAVADITGGDGVDLFYDNIANPEICPLGLKSLKQEGKMVTAGAHGGPVVPVDFDVIYHNRLTIMGNPRSNPKDALPCFDAAAKGQLKAVIDRIVPLSDAPLMHGLLESADGQSVGKIILDPSQG
jgi:NADPH:quinone reductase-like Zn-dependent oxidoreductase